MLLIIDSDCKLSKQQAPCVFFHYSKYTRDPSKCAFPSILGICYTFCSLIFYVFETIMKYLLGALLSVSLLSVSLSLQAQAPDFAHMKDVKAKQAAFFNYLLPFIGQANKKISAQREKIIQAHQTWQAKHSLSSQQTTWLKATARHYHLTKFDDTVEKDWQALLSRVDTVPPSMVLAQAANESAWGSSRFARVAQNYFGQWCYSKGCGVVPSRRAKGAHHEVKRFDSPLASVMSYMYNLNANTNYALFRELRFRARQQHDALKGTVLARGLVNYSERRGAYVKSIQSMIRVHHLEKYDVA